MFTVNNPTEEQKTHLHQLRESLDLYSLVRYIAYQLERGETCNTLHLQGYIEFRQKRTMNQVKETLQAPGAHLEPRHGSQEQARDYCLKEETRVEGPWEGGTLSQGSGERTDLDSIRQLIKEGSSELDIADSHFGTWCTHHKAFARYKTLCLPQRDFKTNVTVIIGPPGTGKSKYCLENFPGAYWKQRSQWWDCYEGQPYIVIDDYYGWLPYDVLLRICDRYPLLVETKGAQAQFTGKEIVITSNTPPTHWYKNVVTEAFIRRVTKWIFMGLGETRESSSWEEFEEVYNQNSTDTVTL